MGFVKWLGRVSLWILFLPLGLWRSIRHGKKQSERRQAKLFAQTLREDREARAREEPTPPSHPVD